MLHNGGILAWCSWRCFVQPHTHTCTISKHAGGQRAYMLTHSPNTVSIAARVFPAGGTCERKAHHSHAAHINLAANASVGTMASMRIRKHARMECCRAAGQCCAVPVGEQHAKPPPIDRRDHRATTTTSDGSQPPPRPMDHREQHAQPPRPMDRRVTGKRACVETELCMAMPAG